MPKYKAEGKVRVPKPEGSQKLRKGQTRGAIKRLIPYYKPYWGTMVLDLLCAAMTTVCELVLPLIVRRVTNTATGASGAAFLDIPVRKPTTIARPASAAAVTVVGMAIHHARRFCGASAIAFA